MHEIFPSGQLDLLSIWSHPCRPAKGDADVTLETSII